jgi:hypothetical protein
MTSVYDQIRAAVSEVDAAFAPGCIRHLVRGLAPAASALFLLAAAPADAQEVCTEIRAASEAALDAALGLRLREPGPPVTVTEGDPRPVRCLFQLRATGNELERAGMEGFAHMASALRQGLAGLGFADTQRTQLLIADGPRGTVDALERDGLICRTAITVQALPPDRRGADLYGGVLAPWERGYAIDIVCFDADGRDVPRFEDYEPFEIVAPEAVVPNIASHPEARRFRTMIRRGAERGAAFAGHLAVAEWGCGTGCQQYAFIDARNGRVYWGPVASHGAAFRHDSRLFVVNPPETLPEGPYEATRYYVWDGEALMPLDQP